MNAYIQQINKTIEELQRLRQILNDGFRDGDHSGCESLAQYDSGAYLLLSQEGAVLAVSGNSEFNDIDKHPAEKGIIVCVAGNYSPPADLAPAGGEK